MHTITNYPFIEIPVIAGVLVVLAIVILLGKGDWLIAGYNTASKEQKDKYIMPRLRGLLAAILVCAAIFVLLLLFAPALTTILTIGFVAIVVVGLVLANTWAKKK